MGAPPPRASAPVGWHPGNLDGRRVVGLGVWAWRPNNGVPPMTYADHRAARWTAGHGYGKSLPMETIWRGALWMAKDGGVPYSIGAIDASTAISGHASRLEFPSVSHLRYIIIPIYRHIAFSNYPCPYYFLSSASILCRHSCVFFGFMQF